MRHPGVAIAILHGGEDREATAAAVLLVLLVGAVLTGIYAKWRGRGHGAKAPGATHA